MCPIDTREFPVKKYGFKYNAQEHEFIYSPSSTS